MCQNPIMVLYSHGNEPLLWAREFIFLIIHFCLCHRRDNVNSTVTFPCQLSLRGTFIAKWTRIVSTPILSATGAWSDVAQIPGRQSEGLSNMHKNENGDLDNVIQEVLDSVRSLTGVSSAS